MTDLFIGIGIGAALVFLGVFAGVGWSITEFSKTERRRKALEAQPICGCRHHYSYHDDVGGACHYIYNESYTNPYTCGCQRYVGPEVRHEL